MNPAGPKKLENGELSNYRNILRQVLQELELDTEFIDWEVIHSLETKELRVACQYLDRLFLDFKQRTKTATLVLL